MNPKYFTGLALAAALLIGEPAFAHGHKDGGGAKHAVAAAHARSGGARVAAVHRSGGGRVASISRGSRVASGRSFREQRNIAAARSNVRASRSEPTVAFSGNSNEPRDRGNGRQFAFRSHDGWDRNRSYSWNGHHYRWYDDAWFIVDPYPVYGAGPYYGSAPVSVQVQQALANDGYYQGPVDGLIGPGTRGAISAFQRDNGLRVTGTITPSLLSYLGVD